MNGLDHLAFLGAGLDRAAPLRADPSLADSPRARAICLWQGRVAMQGERLARVGMDHPFAGKAGDPMIFLGREDDGTLLFAVSLSAPIPEEGVDGDPIHPDLPEAPFADLRMVMTRLPAADAEAAAMARSVAGWHLSHRFCAACGAESRPAQLGWQRDCAACGAHHFPRTDPVAIVRVLSGNSVLVGRSPGWPEKMYSLLAGFVEPGETLEDAARREVFEEAGIRLGRVGYVASQPWPFPSSLMLGCEAEALDREITLDPKELEDAFWISREELAEVFAGTHPRMREPRRGAIAHQLLLNWLRDTHVDTRGRLATPPEAKETDTA